MILSNLTHTGKGERGLSPAREGRWRHEDYVGVELQRGIRLPFGLQLLPVPSSGSGRASQAASPQPSFARNGTHGGGKLCGADAAILPVSKPTEVKGSTFPPRPKAPAPAETLVHSKAPPPAETLGDKLAAYFIRYRVSNIDRHRLVAHRHAEAQAAPLSYHTGPSEPQLLTRARTGYELRARISG